MPAYIVTFEVNNPLTRANLKREIQRLFPIYCPIHENSWAVNTNVSAKEIRDRLVPYITNVDRLFVIRSGTEAAWQNSYGQLNNDWLKNHL